MNQTTEMTLPELPAKVAAALGEALSRLPGGGHGRVKADSTGALNHVLFVETTAGRCVFRMRREESSVLIFDYLRYMYRCTGFFELGGVFRLRDMPGEAAFMPGSRRWSSGAEAAARRRRLDTPRVHPGPDHTLGRRGGRTVGGTAGSRGTA